MIEETSTGYSYTRDGASHTHAYLWGKVVSELHRLCSNRVFELGCGNGALARHLKSLAIDVTGVDPSETGIAFANKADPSMTLRLGSAYDPLELTYGQFQTLVSLEVVEHVYYPRKYAQCVSDLLKPGGYAIISTPYHGYLKNLVLALSGKMDSHFTALWDHGHIKFWSIKTLTQLFSEQGMILEKVHRVGRIPLLGKSMILIFRKPEDNAAE